MPKLPFLLPIVVVLTTFAVAISLPYYGPLLQARYELRAVDKFPLSTRMLVRHFDQKSGTLGKFCEVIDGTSGEKLDIVSVTWGVPLVLFKYEASQTEVTKKSEGSQLFSYCNNGEELVVHAISLN